MTAHEENNEVSEPQPRLIAEKIPDENWPASILVRSISLSGIFLIMLVVSLHAAAEILIPIVIAYSLNLLLSPIISKMSEYRVPAPLSAGVVMVLFIGLAITALYNLSGPAEQWVERSPQIISEVKAKLKPIMSPISGAQEAASSVNDLMTGRDEKKTQQAQTVEVVLPGSQSRLEQLLERLSSTLGSIGIVVVLLYFLLAAGDKFLNKLVIAIDKLQDKKRAVSIIREIQRDTSRYLITRTLINIGLGCAVALALYLLGMPNPILWGAMAAVLNFAPYVGPAISLGIITLAAIISMDTLAEAFLVPSVVLIINIIEGEFISHQVIGKRLALSPVVVFISIVFWGWLWGIAGALMAIPIIAAINVVCQKIDAFKPFSNFISESNDL